MASTPFDAAVAKADSLIALRRHEEALLELDKALAMEPNRPRVLCMRSMVLHRMGRYAEALDSAQRATGLAPHLEWAHRLRSIELAALRRPAEEVLAAATACVAAAPHDWRARLAMADAYLYAGRTIEAGIEGAQCAALAPDDAEALLATAKFAPYNREIDRERILRHALVMDPTNYRVTLSLGSLFQETGRKKEARALFLAAARLEPTETAPGRHLLRSLDTRRARRQDPEAAAAIEPLRKQQQQARRALFLARLWNATLLVLTLVVPAVIFRVSIDQWDFAGLVPGAVGVGIGLLLFRAWHRSTKRLVASERDAAQRYPVRRSALGASNRPRSGQIAGAPLRVQVNDLTGWRLLAAGVGLMIIVVGAAGFPTGRRSVHGVASTRPRVIVVPEQPTGTLFPSYVPPTGRTSDLECVAERRQWQEALDRWAEKHPNEKATVPDLFPSGDVPKGNDGIPDVTIGTDGEVDGLPGTAC